MCKTVRVYILASMFRWLETGFKMRLDINNFFFPIIIKGLDILIPRHRSTRKISTYALFQRKKDPLSPKIYHPFPMLLPNEKEIQKERAYETIALPAT